MERYRHAWVLAYEAGCREVLPPPARARRDSCFEAAHEHDIANAVSGSDD
jgi:hypothetical protein